MRPFFKRSFLRALLLSSLAPPVLSCATPDESCASDSSLSPRWERIPPLTQPRANHTSTLLPDGTVLVIGGRTREATPDDPVDFTLRTAERFNPITRTWQRISPPLRARRNHTSTLLTDGRVLITGGEGPSDDPYDPPSIVLAETELFDPHTATFSPGPKMVASRTNHTALRVPSGEVWLIAGSGRIPDGSAEHTTEIFDPHTNTFRPGPRLEGWSSSAALVGARIFTIDPRRRRGPWPRRWFPIRRDKPLPALLEVIEIGTKAVRSLRPPSVPLIGGVVMPLDERRVYVLGAVATHDTMNEAAWIIDVDTDRARSAALPVTSSNRLVALPDGRLLSLGVDDDNVVQASVFDGTTWWPLPAPPTQWHDTRAVALNDGAVLFAGGAISDQRIITDEAALLFP